MATEKDDPTSSSADPGGKIFQNRSNWGRRYFPKGTTGQRELE
jgi:hypothetical protein